VIARDSGSRSRGTTMCTPLVRRSSGRPTGISNRAIISSVHAPAASTTTRAVTLLVSPGQPVAHRNAGDPAVASALEPGHLGVGVARRTERAGVERVLEHEPRVVGVAVVVLERAAQPLEAQRRLEVVCGTRAAKRLVQPRRAEQRERVVDPQADVHHLEPGLGALVDRDQERQRADQVRRDAGLHPALRHGLEHQADLAVLEVAQAAVDQLARLRRRARGVVALLEQHDP